ncbi:MAG: Ig domain-containing protein, partial [Myxococcota bacterium]
IEITLQAGSASATRLLTFDIRENANLLILPNVLSPAVYDSEYTAQLQAQGGVPPYTWIFDGGTLPRGITLSASGELSGTPRQVGTFRFVVEARDAAPGLQATRDRNAFVLQVDDVAGFTINTESLPTAVVGSGYDYSIAANGGTPPYTWTLQTGRLPDGLFGDIDPNTNEFRIRGAPEDVGVTNLLIRAIDAQNREAIRAFALEVVASDISAEDAGTGAGGCVCRAPSSPPSTATLGLLTWMVWVMTGRRRRGDHRWLKARED